MNDIRRIFEALDCCRPGSDDLRHPDLAEVARSVDADRDIQRVFKQLQRVETLVSQAVTDVPEPVGLSERILARLEEAHGDLPTSPTAAAIARAGSSVAGAEVETDCQTAPLGAVRRRSWIWQLSAIAATLILAVGGIWHFWPSNPPLSRDSLLASAANWYSQLKHGNDWKPFPNQRTFEEYPMSAAVRATPRRWADVSAAVGRPAMAYDLTDGAGHRAALLVIPDRSPLAGNRPSLTPGSSTGGLMIGCWQTDGVVYVLVVEGDQRAYRNLIDAADGPLA